MVKANMAPQNKPPKDTSGAHPLPPINRKTMKSGLINQGAVGENERPASSVMESLNMHFDAIGTATIRKGSQALGTGLDASPVLGLHYFVDNSGGVNGTTQIMAVTGTTLYYLAAGTWTSKRTSLTAGSKARFTTFLNFAWMVNGTEATEVWTGNTADNFSNGGNASGAPTGTYIENFITRVWIAGNSTYPDRLYYSSVPSAASTPVVSWSTDPVTGTQWIDISPQDGDTITGLQRFRQWLIIFKTNHLYRLLGIGQVDPDPYYAVGTSSQESIIETKAGIFFHHASGIYQFNIYGIVQEVSRPIWDIIRAIPASQYPSITGWLEADQDHVCWSVGTVTIAGITYTNLVIRYTISTQCWTHYTYPAPFVMAIRRQPFYTDTTYQYAVVGDNAGKVVQLNVTGVGTDYGNVGIPYSLIHAWDNVDGLLSTRKTAMTANFSHYHGSGSNVNFQTETNDPDNLNDWSRRVGQLGEINTGFNTMNIKARKLRFRISGVSTGQGMIYNGYEMLDVVNEFIQFPQGTSN